MHQPQESHGQAVAVGLGPETGCEARQQKRAADNAEQRQAGQYMDNIVDKI